MTTDKKLISEQQKHKNAIASRRDRQDAFYERLKADCPILWREPPEKGWSPRPGTSEFWNDAIYVCSMELEQLINEYIDVIPLEELPYVVQVKEKFGGLRFYTNGTNCNEAFRNARLAIISKAEKEIADICTRCGNHHGAIRGNFYAHPNERFGWIVTLCETCWYKESIQRAKYSGSKELRKWFCKTMTVKGKEE